MKFVGRVGISVKNDGNRSLGANRARDRSTNAFRASRDQDNFVFKFEIHSVSVLVVSRTPQSLVSPHSRPAREYSSAVQIQKTAVDRIVGTSNERCCI